MNVPAGTSYARLSLFDADVAAGSDIDVMVISEEPGTGFGARVAGLTRDGEVERLDPGHEIGEGPPPVRVRVDQHPVGLRVEPPLILAVQQLREERNYLRKALDVLTR